MEPGYQARRLRGDGIPDEVSLSWAETLVTVSVGFKLRSLEQKSVVRLFPKRARS